MSLGCSPDLGAARLESGTNGLKSSMDRPPVHTENEGREQPPEVVPRFIEGGVVIHFCEPLRSECLE